MLQQKNIAIRMSDFKVLLITLHFQVVFFTPPPPLDVETRIPNDSNGAIQLAQQPCEKPETTDITK